MQLLIYFLLALICLLPAAPLWAADSTETAADLLQVLLPASAYAVSFSQDDQQGRTQFHKSFFSTVAATYLLKVTIDAEAPNGKGQAFPSGHTSMAFSGASFLQQRYGWRYGAPAYLAAAFTGWSRIDSEDHEFRDVFAGAVLGIGFSYLFTERFVPGGFQARPLVDRNFIGLQLERQF